MKSLPEDQFWKAVSSRLEQYSEDPGDDDWDQISGALPTQPSKAQAINRTADVIALIVVAFLLGFGVASFSGNELADSGLAKDSINSVNDKSSPSDGMKNERQRSPNEKSATTPLDSNKDKAQPRETSSVHLRSEQEEIEKQHRMLTVIPEVKPGEDSDAGGSRNVSQDRLSDKSNTTISVDGNQQTMSSNRYTIKENLLAIQIPAQSNRERSGGLDTVPVKSGDPVLVEKITRPNDTVTLVKTDSIIVIAETKAASLNPKTQAGEKKKQRKFHPVVFAQFNPFLAYQKIIPVTDDDITIQKLNSPGIFSTDRFALGGEVGLQIPVAPFLEMYASLGHHRQRTTISYEYLSDENPDVSGAEDELSFEITPSSRTSEYTYAMRSNSLSAGVLYLIRGSKLQHKVGAGVFIVNGNRKVTSSDGVENIKSRYAGYQLQYRLEYTVTPRAAFYLQPTFRRSVFTSKSAAEPFTMKPYWAGIGVGVVYHF